MRALGKRFLVAVGLLAAAASLLCLREGSKPPKGSAGLSTVAFLGRGEQPQWSPDGQFISFLEEESLDESNFVARDGADSGFIATVAAIVPWDGRGKRMRIDSRKYYEAVYGGLTWASPHDLQWRVKRGRRWVIMRSDFTLRRQRVHAAMELPADAEGYLYLGRSASGRHVAFHRSGSLKELWVKDFKTGRIWLAAECHSVPDAYIVHQGWSPDDQQLYYRVKRRGLGGFRVAEEATGIWAVDVAAGDKHKVTDLPQVCEQVRLGHDDGTLAYVVPLPRASMRWKLRLLLRHPWLLCQPAQTKTLLRHPPGWLWVRDLRTGREVRLTQVGPWAGRSFDLAPSVDKAVVAYYGKVFVVRFKPPWRTDT